MAPSTGAFLRYSYSPIHSRKRIYSSRIAYVVPLRSVAKHPPTKGLFLCWSSSGRPFDAAYEAELRLALTYSPAGWARVLPDHSTRILDNLGNEIHWGPSSTRVWPAFGQPGGAYEAIWEWSA